MPTYVPYPAFQVGATGNSKVLSTAASQVIDIPRTSSGGKPSFIRVSVSAGAAYMRLATTATTATAITTDTIVTVSDCAFITTLGATSIGMLMVTGGSVVVGQVTACEEGSLLPSPGAGTTG